MSTVISFGASITYGSELPDQTHTWSSIIARNLGLDYLCLAEPAAANSSIARTIMSYEDYKDDLILVMWTSSTRYEFRTESDWEHISPWSDQTGFVQHWYRGPGQYEYTEVVTTLKEILLATSFLKKMGQQFLFVFDNDELRTSHTWSLDDPYIRTLTAMLPWDNILWFEDTGFLNWCRDNQYSFVNSHPGIDAHLAAANYILANRSFTVSKTS
jgi:hypothetical protein